ncbi:hypothetical protein [Hymenobacter persicinus]|uniref:Outer membrane protein beta-barrel domain-containing protein n=1 Tax=Hymenobacter persicinus TaxID=2025506 RepID=A0A4V1ZB03_9BACT|nr:hypothetical protein [Hymenobacter persicinus]RYU81600.1 hypothetical protein EWM57_06285 [Hymenobacter persicinus]
MKKQLLLPLLLLSTGLAAQDIPASPYEPYKTAVGILANPRLLGIQAERRVGPHFGLRLAATQVFDYHQRQNEFSAGGLGLLTYYLPVRNSRIEPVLGVGAVYSLYHWNLGITTNMRNTKGNLQDVNLGGGAGMNLRFSNGFRAGFSLLAANGFRAEYVENDMRIVERRLLVLPALSLDVLL